MTSSEYIWAVLPWKIPLIFSIYGVNLFLLVIASTLAFDNLKPFVALGTLKFLSRVYMVFSIVFWGLEILFIGVKLREVILVKNRMQEEGFDEKESEDIENLVKQSLSVNESSHSKLSNLASRLKNKKVDNLTHSSPKHQEIEQIDHLGREDPDSPDNHDQIGSVTYRNRIRERYGGLTSVANSNFGSEYNEYTRGS